MWEAEGYVQVDVDENFTITTAAGTKVTVGFHHYFGGPMAVIFHHHHGTNNINTTSPDMTIALWGDLMEAAAVSRAAWEAAMPSGTGSVGAWYTSQSTDYKDGLWSLFQAKLNALP